MGVCGRESGFVKRVGDYLVLSPVEPFEPRMKRVLLPVKWGRRTYLIPPEELKKFSDAVIEGDEPRSEDAHGRFYMRGPDGRVGGTPELPEPWATYLRKNAVIGMIVEVGEGGRARIDLGSAHGINARSILTVQGREHLSGRQLKTVAVDARSCAVEHVYAPGDYGIPLEVGCTVVGARATGEKVDTGGEGAR
jgi:hypothetical protein